MTMDEDLRYEVSDQIAEISLARPPVNTLGGFPGSNSPTCPRKNSRPRSRGRGAVDSSSHIGTALLKPKS